MWIKNANLHYKDETDMIYSLKALWRPSSLSITEEQIADENFMPVKESKEHKQLELEQISNTSQDVKSETTEPKEETPEETPSL